MDNTDYKIQMLERHADEIEKMVNENLTSPFDQYRANDLREQARIERIKQDKLNDCFWENV